MSYLPLTKAVALGFIASMRASSGPAWAIYSIAKRPHPFWVGLAVLELVMDKMPPASDRISPPQLGGRAISGALSALYANRHLTWRRERIAVFVAGGLTAIAGSFLTFQLRKHVVQKLQLPDPVFSALEDAFAYEIGHEVFGHST